VPALIVHAPGDVTPFGQAFARIRSEFDIPVAFPAPVDAEAAAVVKRGPVVPSGAARVERVDARDVPFVTIDPPGSLDLDQAFHAERRANGFRVHYAIADVAAFVAPGGALDRESFARGVTLYLPDGRAPMLPNVLGEGGASLLPEQERPAVLWTIDLDETGAATSARLERATVRSRAKLDYGGVQTSLDNGRADEPLQLLREVGELRRALEAARGGVSLDLPSQEVVPVSQKEGMTFALEYAAPLPVETWNAQISLLAGMEAAKIMLDARAGILRVVPAPQSWQIDRLRRSARGLDIPWPRGKKWSDVVRSLDREDPDAAAFLTQAAHLLRGAGYAELDASNTTLPGSNEKGPAVPIHAGVAAPYAHVTAPLRRLADRYANEIVLAHCAGDEPPEWAMSALDELVDTMQVATRREHAVDRAVVDAVECAVLAPHVGEQFDAFVVDRNKQGVVVQLRRPAIIASVPANLPLGEAVEVTLVAVDPLARRVDLAPGARTDISSES
jgi:VacB/RNase II family 3'-5' exoribonuclease